MSHGGLSQDVRRRNAAEAQGLEIEENWHELLRILIVVVCVSAAVWALVTGLRWSVHWTSDALLHYVVHRRGWLGPLALLGCLTLGGLARGLLIRRPGWAAAEGDGIDVALTNYHSTYDELEDDPGPRYKLPDFGIALRKAIMSLLTLGSGGSGGLEGPVILMGESLAAGCARILGTKREYALRIFQMCGISAALGTLLQAPFAAALFATEIVYSDRIVYRSFVYALLAAVVAFVLNNRLFGYEPLFIAPSHAHVYALSEYGSVTLVAILVSVPVALAMGVVYRKLGTLTDRVDPMWRGAFGALGAGVVALSAWYALGLEPIHLLGMGEHTLRQLLEGNAPAPLGSWWVLALAVAGKMITTTLTLRSGGSAGLLIPGMFLGGVSGASMFQLGHSLGLISSPDASIYVVAGIAAALVALAHVPLAAIALVLEVFGPAYGPPAIVSCGLCYVLTKHVKTYQPRLPESLRRAGALLSRK